VKPYFTLLAVSLLWACSTKSTSDPTIIEPQETDEERAQREAREREEKEAQEKAEAEAEAEAEARRQARQEFCEGWSQIICRDEMDCHPDATTEQYSGCLSYKREYCEHFLPSNVNIEAGAECFAHTAEYDCTGTLDQHFSQHCSAVFSDGSAMEGEGCHAQSDCSVGLVCAKEERGYCTGSCTSPAALGEDCENIQCAAGLACVTDSNGQTCQVAEEMEPTDIGAGGGSSCNPWEIRDADDVCRSRPLPLEQCEGSEICLGNAYCAEDETCKFLFLKVGSSCSDQSDCDGYTTCYGQSYGGPPLCEWGGDHASPRYCFSEHRLVNLE